MANIEKRKNSDGDFKYRVKVRLRGHPAQTATFDRITDAKRYAQVTEAAIREGRHFKTSQSKKRTLTEAIERYGKEYLSGRGRQARNQTKQLEWWLSKLGAYSLSELTPALIIQQRNALVGSSQAKGRTVGPSTANRYLATLSHLFSVSVNEWEWMDSNPVAKIKKLKEPRGRVRFLDDEERSALLSACRKSENPMLYPAVVLALSTGARKMEILGLRWKDVDLVAGRIICHQTKNGERRSLPLHGHALAELTRLEKHKEASSSFVFPSWDKARPMDIRKPWERAARESKLEDFRFHDLRHSAASYLAMNGASLSEIAEVLGHKSLQMVKRYTHLSETHTSKVVARMNEKIFQ